MEKEKYYIKGMHCNSCEILIENKLEELEGISNVHTSLSEEYVTFYYSKNKPTTEYLNKLFDNKYIFSENNFEKTKSNSVLIPVIISIIIIGLFFSLTQSKLSSLVNISSNNSLPAVFAFGLIAGISSCAALVGGLILSLSKQWNEEFKSNNSFFEKIKPHLGFNLGRIISYSLFGFLLGLLGSQIKISPILASITIIITSIIMLILGLQMIGVKQVNKFKIAIPKKISKTATNRKEKINRKTPFIVGFLTIILPCGFTIITEGLAITSQDPISGLMIMLFFTLGTMIPLLAIGLFSTSLINNKKTSDVFQKTAGILVIFFVFYNLNFQFGILNNISNKFNENKNNTNQQTINTNKNICTIGDTNCKEETQKNTPSTEPENINSTNTKNDSKDTQDPKEITQIIKTTYTADKDINPSIFTVKNNQPVRFAITVNDTGIGCMESIMIPDLFDTPKPLRKGQEIVMDFTPRKTGDYPITCAMGVPRGTIKVID